MAHFNQVQKIYIAFYQRPADPAGLKYWTDRVDAAGGDIGQVINAFASSPEAVALYGPINDTTIGSVIDSLYMALFNVAPDAAGRQFYVDGFADGTFTAGTIALAVLNGAQNDDLIAINNKLLVANEFTQQVDGREMTDPLFGTGTSFDVTYDGADVMAARELLAGVTSLPGTVLNDGQITDALRADIANVGDPILVIDTSANMLTVGQDQINATAAGQTFTAPIVQNQLGAITNTLESGDVIAAIGTGNKLVADIAVSTVGLLPIGPAISAATNNVQVVELRAQTINLDLLGGAHPNFSNVDAENFNGVEQWWSVNSRSNLQVEDVRSRPEDTTIGMRNTDPEVSFFVYFDPEQLTDEVRAQDSALTLKIDDVSDPGNLTGVPIDGLKFSLDGVVFTLRSAAMGNATTQAEFVAALQIELAKDAGLAGVTATLNPDNTITLEDPAGKTFSTGSWSFINDDVPANGNIVFTQTVGDPLLLDVPIATNVLLDNVGRTSPGGDLDVGSLGDGGVAEFNVTVDRSSWVTSMESTSHLGNFVPGIQLEHLETVNLVSTGANGNVVIGQRTNNLDGRVVNGLNDVRVVDGSAFKGSMKVGINLNAGGTFDGSIARYLDGATAPVDFMYTGTDKADIFNINVDAAVSSDPDFRMDVDMGAADDRLILTGASVLKNISIDGGAGNNTFVTSSSIGTNANTTFASFAGFQNFEVEGNGNTTQDFTTLVGVTNVVVATTGVVSTQLIDLPVADVSISGKNQTIGANSNADQVFSTIQISGADAAELTVSLDNTARIDGNLNVGTLVVDDFSPANQSAVRTLNIESNGARDTTNSIKGINAERVGTFNLLGTQDLTAEIVNAANSLSAPAARVNLVVDASDLTGDLDLTVDGVLLSNIDAGTTSTVALTGTAGAADDLRLSNAILTTTDTTISGFETVHFGNREVFDTSSGIFDATNVSGVTLYDVNDINNPLTLKNLANVETVQINTDQAAVAGQGALSFLAKNASATSELTLNFRDFDAATDPAVDTAFAGDLTSVQNFRSLTLDLGSEPVANTDYTFSLNVQDADGTGIYTGPLADINFGTINTQLLTVVGGGDAGVAGVAGGVDSVNLGLLVNTFSSIDLSGYVGRTTFTLAVIDPTVDVDNVTAGIQTFDRNTTIDVNGYGMNVTEIDQAPANDSHITTFHFTTDAVAATEDWTIAGFDAIGNAGITLSNLSVLDMRDLGVTGLVDLNFVDTGADVVITSNAGLNFEITLTGIANIADLTGDNFQFAA